VIPDGRPDSPAGCISVSGGGEEGGDQGDDGGSSLFPSEYKGLSDADAFVRGLIRVIFIIATLAVLLYLILGGFKWVTSGGDKAKTEEARNMLTAAIIGLAIIALSFVVVTLLEAFFGIDITSGGIVESIREARNGG